MDYPNIIMRLANKVIAGSFDVVKENYDQIIDLRRQPPAT
jgi:hypothetical protein